MGQRIDKVTLIIKKNNSDLLGVQEALHNQMMDLKNNLPEYEFVGVGRDYGKERGEYSAIFYKKKSSMYLSKRLSGSPNT